jgi:hypothetical protein
MPVCTAVVSSEAASVSRLYAAALKDRGYRITNPDPLPTTHSPLPASHASFKTMERAESSTAEKALQINLDGRTFGTFAEIGGGQEVVRWFFRVGKASATVAKSISAYDTTVSDEIYGRADHYVSRGRLTAMLDYEYRLLVKRLDEKRGERSCFFAFCETVATRIQKGRIGGHGWIGIRFQAQPRTEPSDVMLHVQLLDALPSAEQEALGILGVNLIYSAFYEQNPERIVACLMDDLNRKRIEVDMIKFSGPAFAGVDNRLMSLQLIEQGLTSAVMFDERGDVIQPSEVLSGKSVLIERGSFRPVTNITLDMIERARAQISDTVPSESVVVMEMTLKNLMSDSVIDHRDFLARVDTLVALGKMVMISDYERFDQVTAYLRRYTQALIGMVMGMPLLQEIFDEKYYAELDGGILEGLGRLFKGAVKLYVYPMKRAPGGDVCTTESLEIPNKLKHLYSYVCENGYLEPIRDFQDDQLHVSPRDVLAEIQSGEPGWETLVPPEVAAMIKQKDLFGYSGESA